MTAPVIRSAMISAHTTTVNRSSLYSAGGDQINNTNITNNADPNPDADREERRTIARWLSALNFKAVQVEFIQRRARGTGRWLLDSQVFRDWCEGKSETLWCPGNPGVGKTFLTSIVINHLQTLFKDNNIAIVFIYCNYKEQTLQTITNLVASLLKQMVQESSVTSDNVKSFYHSHNDRDIRPTLDELTKTLELEIGTYSKVFIIVDALDECPEDNGNRANLLEVLQSLAGPINLMVTSRDLPSIARHFDGTKRLYIRADDQDVQSYVDSRISNFPRRHLLALRETIVNDIVENVQGMFLLARLHMDSLVGKHDVAAVRKALQNLPKEVDGTYDEAMERIERQNEEDEILAKRVLSWITYAYRPLHVRELQHALAVTPEMTDMDPDKIIDEEILTSVCAGLVVVDAEQKFIRLVHYTTQQYFERMRGSLFPFAQANITVSCLTYLSFDVFGRGYCQSDQELESLLGDNVLLDYTARHWGDHARGCMEEFNQDVALRFLQGETKVACASQVLLRPGYRRWGYSQMFPKAFSGKHMCSFFGLPRILHSLLENDTWANSKDSYGRTLLSWAAENGHEAVVRMLAVQDGIEVNLGDTKYGRTPLSMAAEKGHETIIQLLLARDDVDVDSKDCYGRTPLSWAAKNGHEAVVRMLIALDNVQVDSRDSSGKTPLSWAADNEHKTVVQLLLARDDVQVDLKDAVGRTPLSRAAGKGHLELVKMFLAREDVEADSKDGSGVTPLAWAAQNEHTEVMKVFLLRHDVNVDFKDRNGSTLLSSAAESGYEAIVKLLLARDDVDVNSKDRSGKTPLFQAARNGNVAIVKLFLARGDVDANSKDGSGMTPLFQAARDGHVAIVKMLLARDGVEVSFSDSIGMTRAARMRNVEMLKIFLTRVDIQVNSKDVSGFTPLSWAVRMGYMKMLNMLLERDDVEVNSKDNNGVTPLFWAVRLGRTKILQTLLARDDVEVNLKDDRGWTPLSWALGYEHEAIVKLLLVRHDVEGHPRARSMGTFEFNFEYEGWW